MKRWHMNRVGLVNFWYYEDQEFTFADGKMLLRGANGSGKSVTMQSVIPLLLDGNSNPKRLDPFGSRDRKLNTYLIEEGSDLSERIGYLYIEYRHGGSGRIMTFGIGMRAVKGGALDKWYFAVTDGRRIGKDLPLYRERDRRTLTKAELKNSLGDGGKVFDNRSEYRNEVNKKIFGFETSEDFEELIELLIQIRSPKLSREFKPSVINEILTNSLPALTEEDLRPMAEAVESMDELQLKLEKKREGRVAAEKICRAFDEYNGSLLYHKAVDAAQEEARVQKLYREKSETEKAYADQKKEYDSLLDQIDDLEKEYEASDKEMDNLRNSDAAMLKEKETRLSGEVEAQRDKVSAKEEQGAKKNDCISDQMGELKKIQDELDSNERKINETLKSMKSDADFMAFTDHDLMEKDLLSSMGEEYDFEYIGKRLTAHAKKIHAGLDLLKNEEQEEANLDHARQVYDLKEVEFKDSEKKLERAEEALEECRNAWLDQVHQWNASNVELKLKEETMRQLCIYGEECTYDDDFNSVKDVVHQDLLEKRNALESEKNHVERELTDLHWKYVEKENELHDWENSRDPEPERSEAVKENRRRLNEAGIPFVPFYQAAAFKEDLDERTAGKLEEALMRMGILDALLVDESYKDQVLAMREGSMDSYLFTSEKSEGKSLLDLLVWDEGTKEIIDCELVRNLLSSVSLEENGSTCILENGVWHNGVVTGTISGTHEASYIGAAARERARQRAMEECRKIMAELSESIQGKEDEVSVFEARIARLTEEYHAMPKQDDLRNSLQLCDTAERNLNICRGELSRRSEEVAAIQQKLQMIKVQALEIANEIGLDCRKKVFDEAAKAGSNYRESLMKLRLAHNNYFNALETKISTEATLELFKDELEQIRVEFRDLKHDLAVKEMELEGVRDRLAMTDIKEIEERIANCTKVINEYPKRSNDLSMKIGECRSACRNAEEKINALMDEIKIVEQVKAYILKRFEAEVNLNYVEIPGEKSASRVRDLLKPQFGNVELDKARETVEQKFIENRAVLDEYQLRKVELFENMDSMNPTYDGRKCRRVDYRAKCRGTDVSLDTLMTQLNEDIDFNSKLIRDKERELFEEVLANTVGREIRNKINASEKWVKDMNAMMNQMNTSSGMKLNLKWRAKPKEADGQMDTSDLIKLLQKDFHLMSESEAERLTSHFRSRVAEAKRRAEDQRDEEDGFRKQMKDALDYRNWFEFQILYCKENENQKVLTNNAFGTLSGGEKAMAMYVPLFSAAAAKYSSAAADSPMIISLDEAFAGVDNGNIKDMFRLISEFGFDFMMNSQVLWGDYDTVGKLAIYQLLRPKNAKHVTVISYLWNGNKRIQTPQNLMETDLFRPEGRAWTEV